MSQTPQIWIALTQSADRLRIEEAASALRLTCRPVSPGGVERASSQCVAVVSDLAPFAASLAWLERLRRDRQGLPIVLYLPVSTGADSALHEAMALGVDRLIFSRGKPDERERLVGTFTDILDQHRVVTLIERIANGVPRSTTGLRVLKHFGIKMAGTVAPADHVETVAAAMGSTPRTLQRALRADGWPGPKELLDWMMLIMAGLAGDLPVDRTDRRRIQRAGARLMHIKGMETPPDPDAVTAAFIQRLND